jgi:DNA-binding NarL/FixJ family response regulator
VSRALRIVVADDHPLFRRGLVGVLSAHEGWQVVAEESDGIGVVTTVHARQPDVVVMDLRMPGLDGIEATRRIVATSPHIAVLVLTMHDDDESVFTAVQAGARGYLLKGADQAQIERAVHTVAEGGVIFGPALAERITAYFAGLRVPPGTARNVFPELTAREVEVLRLVAEGHNNHVIADALVLSEKTVRNHVSNIFFKLQVADRAQAIVRARDAGLGGR